MDRDRQENDQPDNPPEPLRITEFEAIQSVRQIVDRADAPNTEERQSQLLGVISFEARQTVLSVECDPVSPRCSDGFKCDASARELAPLSQGS